MVWTFTTDAAAFAAHARATLETDPLLNTVSLTVLAKTLAEGPESASAHWGIFERENELLGVAHVTGGYPIVVPFAPLDSIGELVAAVRREGIAVSGVNSRSDLSDSFRDRWIAETGTTVDHSRSERLFTLGDLIEPSVEGGWRFATTADDALLVDWVTAFGIEAEVEIIGVTDQVADRHTYNGWVLWERDGAPVSLAGLNRVSGGMSRIGPVYTPPEHRGHGYGAGSTWAASAEGRRRGAEIMCLFTDLGNPTSNALYPRLGYVPVEDRTVHYFTA